MNKNTQLAFAGFLTALALELISGAAANMPEPPADPAPTPEPPADPAPTPEPPADPAPEPKRRGRPAAPAPAPTPAPVEVEEEVAPAPARDVKTLEELQEICKPLMAAGMGVQLKALVKKHGGQNLSTMPVENQAAFLADVDELSL